MNALEYDQLPRWRVLKACVIRGALYNEGVEVRGEVELPPDWLEPLNQAARALRPNSRIISRPDESRRIPRAPLANLEFADWERDRPIFRQRISEMPVRDVLHRPMWKLLAGCTLEIVEGELRRPGERWFSALWPTSDAIEPANEVAQEIAAYYEAHKDDQLPAFAWDEDTRSMTIDKNATEAA